MVTLTSAQSDEVLWGTQHAQRLAISQLNSVQKNKINKLWKQILQNNNAVADGRL